jgi:hypothetical protein
MSYMVQNIKSFNILLNYNFEAQVKILLSYGFQLAAIGFHG